MLRKVPLVSLCICYCGITLLYIATPVFSQSISQTNSIIGIYKRLLDLRSQVLTIAQDLLELQKALATRDPARDSSSSLFASSERTLAYSAHAMDVLFLYQNMSSSKDRTNVKRFVEESLKQVVAHLELEIKTANFEIANTDKPGIVSTATELRNATRQIIDALKAVRL
jgi:hypothetical protein